MLKKVCLPAVRQGSTLPAEAKRRRVGVWRRAIDNGERILKTFLYGIPEFFFKINNHIILYEDALLF